MNIKLAIIYCCLLTISRAHLVQRMYRNEKHDYPNLVALTAYDNDPKLYKVFGAGIIVNEYWVLADGTSVMKIDQLYKKDHVRVIAGQRYADGSQSTNTSYHQSSAVSYSDKHRKYKDIGYITEYNIGLIRLVDPLSFNEYIKAFKLSSVTNFDGQAMIAGWLYQTICDPQQITIVTRQLRIQYINILNENICEQLLKNTLRTANLDFLVRYILHTHICTDSVLRTGRSLNSYSGGPLMKLNRNGEYEVIGITSYTDSPTENPTLHTKVALYLDWIDETIKNNPPTTPLS